MTLLAVFSEALPGRGRTLTGSDTQWGNQLKQPQLANDLRQLRAIVQAIDEGAIESNEEGED